MSQNLSRGSDTLEALQCYSSATRLPASSFETSFLYDLYSGFCVWGMQPIIPALFRRFCDFSGAPVVNCGAGLAAPPFLEFNPSTVLAVGSISFLFILIFVAYWCMVR
uniref:hypothetical protein n=1 Tax=Thiolapillus sp. TaxID=2017437 RepID=UPI003AF66F53